MDAEKIGAFIRSVRKEHGLTQQQLAAQLHVSDKAVSRWETGRGFPDIGTLEDLALALDVNVAEIIKGQRLAEQVTKEDAVEISTESLSLAQRLITQRRWLHLCIGFLAGLALLATLALHLVSPAYITNPDEALAIEQLSDGTLVAVLGEGVSGYSLSDVDGGGAGGGSAMSITCYSTLWDRWTSRGTATLVPLGDQATLDAVYYYPTDEGDRLIWNRAGAPKPDGGIQTLPRLTFNYWIIAAACLGIAGVGACVALRKSPLAGRAIVLTAVPVSLTLGMLAVSLGKPGPMYADSLAFYLSGALLVAFALFSLFIVGFFAWRRRPALAQ